MAAERLKGPRYLVHWPARVLLQDRVLKEGVIKQVAAEGVRMIFGHAVPLGATVNLEFYINYQGKPKRIRAKTQAIYCMVLSSNQGVEMELRLLYMSDQERHALNNAVQLLEVSPEFDLRSP